MSSNANKRVRAGCNSLREIVRGEVSTLCMYCEAWAELSGELREALVETLTAKVKAWESEKGACFLYDKKSLLETLDEDAIKRQQRDEERRRSREHKRLQEQYATEQEVLFGTKPSPLRQLSAKKPLGQSNLNMQGGTPVGRRFSTHLSRPVILSNSKDKKDGNKIATAIPLNYVALSKDC